jgi:CMP-N-acetylneuraminic acid synthetase
MRNVAFIPLRAGSKSIPLKNIKSNANGEKINSKKGKVSFFVIRSGI